MVKHLKVGERVRALAIHALGEENAKRQFPEHWKDLFLFGKIVGREKRSVFVKWDRVADRTKVSTRNLDREEPVAAAQATTAEQEATVEDGDNMIRTTDADGTVTRSVVIESTDDDESTDYEMHGLRRKLYPMLQVRRTNKTWMICGNCLNPTIFSGKESLVLPQMSRINVNQHAKSSLMMELAMSAHLYNITWHCIRWITLMKQLKQQMQN